MKKFTFVLALFFSLVNFGACTKNDMLKDETPQNAAQDAGYHLAGVKTVDSPETKGVALKSKLWYNGTAISIKFLNGTSAQQTLVKNTAAELLQYATSLQFNYVTTGNADVRISIGDTRYISWSTIGTDCKAVTNQSEATMNLAFGSGLTDADKKGDILRSFCQMLGLELEHRHPNLTATWNDIQTYWSSNYNEIPWTTFQQYVVNPLTDLINVEKTTNYDPQSIMIWAFPFVRVPPVTFNGYTVPTAFNNVLSTQDKDFIKSLYSAQSNTTLSPPTYKAKPEGESFSLTITSSGSWTLTSPAWCYLSQASGSGNTTVTVTVMANNTGNDRIGTITVINSTSICTVTQPKKTEVTLSPTSISVPYTAGFYDLVITANTPWTLTAPSWCSLSAASGQGNATVRVTYGENGTNPRSGNITLIYDNGKTIVCPITQAAKPVPGGKVNVIVSFKNNYTQSVSIYGNYRVQLGGAEINFTCSAIIAANNTSGVQVGSGIISYYDINATQNLNIGFSSWSSPSLPSNPTTLVSTRITGDLGGSFQSSSVSGNPAGQYKATNVTWKTAAGVNGTATLEIVYGIGSPGEDWDY